jgi:pyrroloquinoline-quinone synthase
MNRQEFFSQLEARIAKYDLLCHPFYKAWSEGKLTSIDLREYAAEYYHHVAAFPSYLSAFHSRLQDGAMRKAAAENCADEEGVGSPDGRSHAELWMDFAAGFGGSEHDVQSRKPVQEVLDLIASFRRIASEGSAAEALAAFYAYESQVPRVAHEKARGLKQMYGADSKTSRYFTLHTTADVRHSQVWKELLSKEVPEDSSAALDAAESAAKALWTALDGIERQRIARTV